jgi:hypothetical protein
MDVQVLRRSVVQRRGAVNGWDDEKGRKKVDERSRRIVGVE